MSEPKTSASIDALLARASEKLSGMEVYKIKREFLNAVGVMGEAQLYETAAALAKTDPHAAHTMLAEQSYDPDFDPAFPLVRVTLMADIVNRCKEIEGTVGRRDLGAEVPAKSVAGGPADCAREAAFRAQPDRFLVGAEHSSIRLIHAPSFGMVRLAGVDLPWTYAAAGMVHFYYGELYRVVEDGGYAGGILVGPPGAEQEVSLPKGYRFVAVDINTGGEAAR